MYHYYNPSQKIIYDYHSVEHCQAYRKTIRKFTVELGTHPIQPFISVFRLYHRGLLLLNEVSQGKALYSAFKLCQELLLPAQFCAIEELVCSEDHCSFFHLFSAPLFFPNIDIFFKCALPRFILSIKLL